MKPTHGSSWVHIVTDKTALDRAALMETCRGWLKRSYYKETQEWVYKDIEPQIILEEFIDDGGGTAPNDYKFFVFDGTVELIQVDTGRFTDHRRRLYSPTWQKLNARLHYEDIIGDVARPAHLGEMLAAAQKLGEGLDFIRADFYDTGARIYFGGVPVRFTHDDERTPINRAVHHEAHQLGAALDMLRRRRHQCITGPVPEQSRNAIL